MATVIRPTVTTPAGVMRPLPLRLMFFPMCTLNPPNISSGCEIGTPGTVSLIWHSPSRSTETWVRKDKFQLGALYLAGDPAGPLLSDVRTLPSEIQKIIPYANGNDWSALVPPRSLLMT
jgi:hypothetical protein